MMLSKLRMLSRRAFAASNKLATRQFTSSNGKNENKKDHELNVAEKKVNFDNSFGCFELRQSRHNLLFYNFSPLKISNKRRTEIDSTSMR